MHTTHTTMSPHQHAAAKAEVAALRAINTPASNATADGIARSIAQSNAAERAMLQSHLDLCNRRILDAHRYGTITQQNEAEGCRQDAMAAVLAFNQRTIRMVPVTHVRR
jgi:arginine/lysine/ornithine decarboxylase